MGCWRFSNTNNTTQYKRIYHSSHASIKELDAGNSHICGLVNDNETTTNDRLSLECWQWKGFNSTGIYFANIAVGEDFVCGLLEFGRIKCIPNQNNGNNNTSVIGHEPDGNYSVIAAGFRHACAISWSNGSLECWGEMVGEKPSQGKFSSLALGENRSCAMQAFNGTVICWGENNFSLPESLRNISFVAIEAKQRVFCGIVSSDYSLHCWGTEVFDSNSMVFQDVVPGPCTSECPCSSPLPGYGTFCGQGLKICQPCVVGEGSSSSVPLPLTPSPSPISPQPPPQEGTSGGWNKKMVAFLVVGCVGSFSLVMVCCFLFFRYCQVRGSRIHDSGPLDDAEGTSPPHPQSQSQSQTQTQTQTQTQALPVRVLEKRLSQTISMGNGGDHLEEFSLQELHQATNNFSDDHKIGTGSFGSVYHATLHDKRQVAIKRAETSLYPSHVGRSKRQEDKDTAFLNELEFLSRLNHKNLVRLLGYCEDNNELILVYEYMNNGTLHDHLHKHDTLQDEIHRVLDPNVPPPTPYEIEAVAHVGYLAVDCVKPQARYRPTMSYVVNRLEAALAACLATPPNLSLSRSSTRSST
ncbi:Serine/threonine-protein kinase-like protein CCR4 [Camellia lanceoleosa]|uniref:Serine/threonine-protein kinase-like protein CCR4 n=1 Tax=Camellia lanceoleosa TaxID=1840588 RepID=A0ACC0GP84_9ERIC|nr:Serine/threonine-protein kinase-like protein CCR4 [Camellia lanceoleosa]